MANSIEATSCYVYRWPSSVVSIGNDRLKNYTGPSAEIVCFFVLMGIICFADVNFLIALVSMYPLVTYGAKAFTSFFVNNWTKYSILMQCLDTIIDIKFE